MSIIDTTAIMSMPAEWQWILFPLGTFRDTIIITYVTDPQPYTK